MGLGPSGIARADDESVHVRSHAPYKEINLNVRKPVTQIA